MQSDQRPVQHVFFWIDSNLEKNLSNTYKILNYDFCLVHVSVTRFVFCVYIRSLTQRVKWAIAITWRPLPSVRRKLYNKSTLKLLSQYWPKLFCIILMVSTFTVVVAVTINRSVGGTHLQTQYNLIFQPNELTFEPEVRFIEMYDICYGFIWNIMRFAENRQIRLISLTFIK